MAEGVNVIALVAVVVVVGVHVRDVKDGTEIFFLPGGVINERVGVDVESESNGNEEERVGEGGLDRGAKHGEN